MGEAISTSKLYITCEYASEWKERESERKRGTTRGLSRFPDKRRVSGVWRTGARLCESVCDEAFVSPAVSM